MLKKQIPNAITCCNLICGCLAIVQIFRGDLTWASYLIGLAAIFDFFDGFAARLLKVTSPIGKDLDSLADAVTFGVVPSLIIFILIENSIQVSATIINYSYSFLLPYFAFSIAVFSVVRLAKFNNDTRQSHSFIGLPTPANAMLIAALPLILKSSNNISFFAGQINQDYAPFYFVGVSDFILNIYVLIGLCVLQSFLLIAELPLFALKFKQFGWKGNEIRYGFLITCLVLVIAFQYLAIPLILLVYVLISLLNNLKEKRKT